MKKLLLAAVVAVATMVAKADDYSFTYQAELKNDKGKTLSSRNQTVEVRLWKTATGTSEGDLLWGRTYNIYTDENGLFNQEISDSLGSRTSDDPNMKLGAIFCNNGAGTVYLGLKVKDSAGEIVPRQRLFAVPFAGRANSANNLVGDLHTVEGTLKLPGGASLSVAGLDLPATSTSTVGVFTAESVTAKVGLSAGNITFNGKMTDAAGSEVVPVPVGGIIMWTKKEAPANGTWDETGKSADGIWAICNGNNTTPNLSGRFVVGVGSVQDKAGNVASYDLKDEGGYVKHKLTTDEMPKHAHTIPFRKRGYVAGMEDANEVFGTSDANNMSWNSDSAGSDNAHENRPPYCALYYIMRVK